MQREIDNPHSGEKIVIRTTGSETGGDLLEFDLYLQPGGHVPAGHLHPRQQERFTIIDGALRFRIGSRTIVAEAGDTLVVPSGTPHWFGNRGKTVAHVRVEVRPAMRMQELFATSVERSTSASNRWLRLIGSALILLEFQSEVGVPHVPAFIITWLLTPLAWLRLRFAR